MWGGLELLLYVFNLDGFLHVLNGFSVNSNVSCLWPYESLTNCFIFALLSTSYEGQLYAYKVGLV